MVSAKSMRASAKVPELCLRLRQFALEAEPHTRLPSIAELCTLLDVSKATLDEVLSRLEEQEVIYRQNGRGIFVSPELFRQTIAILFARNWLSVRGSSPFWGMLLEHFTRFAEQREAEQQEQHLMYLLPSTFPHAIPLPKDFMRLVEARRIQGVLGVTLDAVATDWLTEHEVPFVTFAGCSASAVVLDEEELVRLALRRLVEQGCHRIGVWGKAQEETEKSIHVVRSLFVEHGLTFDPTLLQTLPEQVQSWPPAQQGSFLARHAFTDAKPDGVIILDDMLTEGALLTLQALGVRLGEELQIATHGNTGSMMLFDILPGVHVIEYDPAELVMAMFQQLDRLRTHSAVEPTFRIKPRYRQKSLSLPLDGETVSF